MLRNIILFMTRAKGRFFTESELSQPIDNNIAHGNPENDRTADKYFYGKVRLFLM